jgi:hypothetical protein
MLIKFTSDAHENITMFGDVAIQLIKMMGHSGVVPGALVADDLPAALERLKQGVSQASNKESEINGYSNSSDDDEVSLSNRAWPLIELLEDANKAQTNVMWDRA